MKGKNNIRSGLLLLCLAGWAAAVPAGASSDFPLSYTMTAGQADLDLAPDVILEGEPVNIGEWASDNCVGFYFEIEQAGPYLVSFNYAKDEETPALIRLETSGTTVDNLEFPATSRDWSGALYEEVELNNPVIFEDSGYLWIEAGSNNTSDYLIDLRSVTITYDGYGDDYDSYDDDGSDGYDSYNDDDSDDYDSYEDGSDDYDSYDDDSDDYDSYDDSDYDSYGEADSGEGISGDAAVIQTLYENSLLPLMFYGESLWNEACEYDPEGAAEFCEEALYVFDLMGVDVSAYTGEEVAEFITSAYEIGYSFSVFELIAGYVEEDPDYYRNLVLGLLNEELVSNPDDIEEYQYLLDGRLPEAAITFKNDWYGDTTDDERIALADAVLYLLHMAECDTGDYTGNTLAQAINDLYDQDSGDSMLYLAVSVCGLDEELAIDLIDYLDDVMYECFDYE